MMNQHRYRNCMFPSGMMFVVLAATIGCGPSTPKTAVVTGIVKTKDGRPCESAFVVFHPQEKGRLNAPKPFATADAQGAIALTTFAQGDGALPGDYGVTIVWPGKEKGREFSLSSEGGSGAGADQLQGRYGDPKNPKIKVSIPDAGNPSLVLEVDG